MKHLLAALAAMLLALTSPALTSPAMAQDKLTVLLDWFVNPDHAPIVIAKEKGLFARHGLDVTLIEPADPSAPPRLVAAGQGDVAVTYQPSYIAQLHEALPVVRIGTLIATPLNTLIVPADGPVKTLADLKGRTIGYSASGFEDVMLAAMLKSVGLTTKDVTLVNVNFALTAAIMSSRVDAIVGGYRNFELTELEIAGRRGRAFFPEEHGVPPYDELIYITRQDKAGDPRMRRFLAAIEEATLSLLNDPDGGWRTFVKAHPKLDDRLNRQAWIDTLPRFQAAPAAVDPARYVRFARFMKENGMIRDVLSAERYTGVRSTE